MDPDDETDATDIIDDDPEVGELVDELDETPTDKHHPKRTSRRRVRVGPRPKTMSKRDLRNALQFDRLIAVDGEAWDRPVTRADCATAPRPCPWVGCKHHLYLSVNPETGTITISFPDLEPWELKQTCALDVASRGGITLEEVGEIMNLTRERIRQVEVRGLLKMKLDPTSAGLR